MASDELPRSVKLRAYANLNRLLEDDEGQAVARVLDAGISDPYCLQLLEKRVGSHRTAEALAGLFPAGLSASSGPVLGYHHVTRAEHRIPIETLGTHLIGVTATGGGKTSLITWLALQLWGIDRDLALWFVDNHKRELRHLRALASRFGISVPLVTPKRLAINVLEAASDLSTRVMRATDLLGRCLEVPGRARTILALHLNRLYLEWATQPTLAPCLIDLFERVKHDRDLNASAREALLDRLGSLCVSLGPSARCRRGWSVSDLTQRSIVWELGDASPLVKTLVVCHLVQSAMLDRIRRGVVNRQPDLLVVLDDAQRFIATSTQAGEGGDVPPLAELLGLIRSTGLGLMAFVQSLAGIPRTLLANLSTKLIGRLGTGADYRDAAETLGLTGEQLRWMQSNLQRGMWVCQLSEGASRAPCALTVPRLTLPASVTDVEVHASADELGNLPVTFASEYEHWSPFESVGAVGSVQRVPSPPSSAPSNLVVPVAQPARGDRLSGAELAFLRAVCDRPMQPSSSYARAAKLSGRTAIEVRESLCARAYLRVHTVQASARGRPTLLIEPLKPAFRAVGRAGTAGGTP